VAHSGPANPKLTLAIKLPSLLVLNRNQNEGGELVATQK
jgi:hypothetical protein